VKVGIGVKFKNSPQYWRPFRQVYEDCIAYARAADRLGFDYVVVPEHHSVQIGYNPTPFLTLTAIARETQRIGLATQPVLLPLYHPVHVAEQLAALDILSGGRAMLGVGVGYRDGDFEAFGVPRRQRGARLEEGLRLLLQALREREVDFEGRFHRVSGVDITPRPLQEPYPKVYLCMRSAAGAARAARFGLDVNILRHEAVVDGVYRAYCEHVADAGLDPAALEVTIVRNGFIAPTADEARRLGQPYIEGRIAYMANPEFAAHDTPVSLDRELIGSPDDWLAAIEEDRAALAGHVPFGGYTLGIWPEGMPLAQGVEALELFAERVLPRLRGL
jgi:alkanesulfonate monooxygenase SsuD/methylene tetrahydromethanopterin reductase-like flavin-dependent oxidoreductase (luciferase family)